MVERTSSILGPDGRAIVVKTLSEEIATPTVAGVRRTHEDRVASGITPERLGTILAEPVLLALRRLAEREAAAARFQPPV